MENRKQPATVKVFGDMDNVSRLGGFTLLEGLVWASLAHESSECRFAARLCRLMALERINLPFLNCRTTEHGCFVDLAVDKSQWSNAATLIKENFDIPDPRLETQSLIASIFPHNRNPETIVKMLRLLSETGIERYALAQSYAALSILMSRKRLSLFTKSMFEYFRFGSYPTLQDWKSRLTPMPVPREIVASYREKRPKVYGLDWIEGMDMTRLESSMDRRALEMLGNMSAAGAYPVFLSGGPETGHAHPGTMTLAAKGVDLSCESPGEAFFHRYPVAVFTMKGPHFGDRYGIAAELLGTLARHQVDIPALSCSMASVTGIVPGDQVPQAVKAVNECFEVPSITYMK